MYETVLSRVKPKDKGFSHDLKDQVLTSLGAGADHFLRTFLSTQVLLSNVPLIPRLVQGNYRKKWQFYKKAEFVEKSETFFKPPQWQEPVVRPAQAMPFDLPDAIYEDIIFPSAFEPLNPEYTAAEIFPQKQPQACARFIRHKDGAERPTLVVVHGFVLDEYGFNASLFEITKFYRLGFNILMYTMPYHGPRMKDHAAFSGDGFMFFDIARINENVRWSVHDLTRFIDFLEKRSKAPIGMMGFSLGGFHTALMASLDDRLAFAIPVVPVVTLFNVIKDWQPSAGLLQFFIDFLGIDRNEIQTLLAPISPLSRPVKLDQNRLFIVAGTADRMAHPDHAQSLWEHWNEPNIYWFPGNHLVHFEKENYMRKVAAFLRGLGLY